VKRISLSEAIDEICRKYFGEEALTLFENARDGKDSRSFSSFAVGWCLVDILNLVSQREQSFNSETQTLKSEVLHLRGLLNKNPTQSHHSPSTNRNVKIKNSREKTGKLPGAQEGHVGACHELHDLPDAVHRYDVPKCIECRASLREAPEAEVIRKQTIDLKDGKCHVTEYQTVIKYCPRCGRWNRGEEPKDLQKARVIFGTNVKCVAVYFLVQQLLPVWRVQGIFQDLFDISVSQGSLCHFVQEIGTQLKDWESLCRIQLLNSPRAHVDETGLRCQKKNHWAHVVSNEDLTLINLHEKRGSQALKDIGILPEYKGHLIHDGFTMYWSYGKTHSLCNAHILRELKYLTEENDKKWSYEMAKVLKTALHEIHSSHSSRSACWKQRLKKNFLNVLKMGYKEEGFAKEWKGRPPDGYKLIINKKGEKKKVPFYLRRKQSKSLNLLDRLRDFQPEVLAFGLKKNIPFSNNQAERDFRMIRLKEKISGCFRSQEMATHFLRVKSYLSTLRKQQASLLENLMLVSVCC